MQPVQNHCMHVLVIQNCEPEGIGVYEQYLKDADIDYTIFHAYTKEVFPDTHYDAFLISGTPISVNQVHTYPFLQNEWEYLKKIVEMGKPCLGVCFGGQLLARLLGASVRKNIMPEIGVYTVHVTKEGRIDPLFAGFPRVFPVFHWHYDTFAIPEGACLLVRGIECKNQAFRHNKVVALQFHLEVTSKDAVLYTNTYENELKAVKKTKYHVLKKLKSREKEMKVLGYLLLDNFFKIVTNEK